MLKLFHEKRANFQLFNDKWNVENLNPHIHPFANACSYGHPGPVFYLLSRSPSRLGFFLQATWSFLSSLKVPWTPSHLTSVADLQISWVALTLLFVFNICLNSYMWHYMIFFTIHLQKAVRILFIHQLGVQWHRTASWTSWVAMALYSVTSLL